MISILEFASRMPGLTMSRQASRDFDNVRVQVEALVANFNASVMDVLGKYHQCTVDHCSAELGAVQSQLAEQQKEFQKELDYRNGLIITLEKERNDTVSRLEKEKNELKTELEYRTQEARKLANFERLELRPSPTYSMTCSQVESEPESCHAANPARDSLELVISRLKHKQKTPRHLPKRRHTHDTTQQSENRAQYQTNAPSVSSRIAESMPSRRAPNVPSHTSEVSQNTTSMQCQSAHNTLSHSAPVMLSEVDTVGFGSERVQEPMCVPANVEITETVVQVKQEYDVDDNDVDVLGEKEVEKPVTPVPGETGEDIDIVDQSSPSTSPSQSHPGQSPPSTDQTDTDRQSETSQEPTSHHSDTSSDNERPTNNNDSTFVNRQSDQLSLPLKKRRQPAAKKRAVKTPEPAEKPKPRRVKALSSDARARTPGPETRPKSTTKDPRPTPANSSVAVGDDAITPLPNDKTKLKRKRAVSLDMETLEAQTPPPRRTTKTSRAARDEPDSDLDDPEIVVNLKPLPPAPDPAEQVLEIGVVHASNTPIMSRPKVSIKTKKDKPRPAKVKRSRSVGPKVKENKITDATNNTEKNDKEKNDTKKGNFEEQEKKHQKGVHYDCTRCTESFTSRADFQIHVLSHSKKRKISAPAAVEMTRVEASEIEDQQAEVEVTAVPDASMELQIASVPELATDPEMVTSDSVKKTRSETKSKEKLTKKLGKKVARKHRRRSKDKKMKSKAKENIDVLTALESRQGVSSEAPSTPPEELLNENPMIYTTLRPNAIKLEPGRSETPNSLGRSTPSLLGRATPDSSGRDTPTGRGRQRGYQGPLHKCHECPATFKYKYCLDNHRGVHNLEHHYKCSKCSASFRNEKGLHDHCTVHENTTVRCSVCQRSFASADQLTAHVITSHSEEAPPSPGKAGKTCEPAVSDSQALKPVFPCNYCTYVSESNDELAEHTAQHKNDRGWKCAYCPSTFRWKGSLDVHMARHEDEARPCSHCGMVLANKQLLNAHVNAEHKLKFEVLTGAEAITQAMADSYA